MPEPGHGCHLASAPAARDMTAVMCSGSRAHDDAGMTASRTERRSTGAFARLRAEHRRTLAALDTFARRALRRRTFRAPPFRALLRHLRGTFTVQLAAE